MILTKLADLRATSQMERVCGNDGGGQAYWHSQFNQHYQLQPSQSPDHLDHLDKLDHLDHLYQHENTGGMDNVNTMASSDSCRYSALKFRI